MIANVYHSYDSKYVIGQRSAFINTKSTTTNITIKAQKNKARHSTRTVTRYQKIDPEIN